MSFVTEIASPEVHSEYSLQKLSGHIGAQIHGVTLHDTLAPELFQRLYRDLLTHKVLFFRGQHHLDDTSHEAFARLFGTLVPHPLSPRSNKVKVSWNWMHPKAAVVPIPGTPTSPSYLITRKLLSCVASSFQNMVAIPCGPTPPRPIKTCQTRSRHL